MLPEISQPTCYISNKQASTHKIYIAGSPLLNDIDVVILQLGSYERLYHNNNAEISKSR